MSQQISGCPSHSEPPGPWVLGRVQGSRERSMGDSAFGSPQTRVAYLDCGLSSSALPLILTLSRRGGTDLVERCGGLRPAPPPLRPLPGQGERQGWGQFIDEWCLGRKWGVGFVPLSQGPGLHMELTGSPVAAAPPASAQAPGLCTPLWVSGWPQALRLASLWGFDTCSSDCTAGSSGRGGGGGRGTAGRPAPSLQETECQT